MTGKNWKATEIIKVLEFINGNFLLWRDSRQNACAKAEKVLKLDRDAKSIYNIVNSLLKAIKTPRTRRACKFLRRRKISGLVKEINEKTDKLNEGSKGKQKVATSSKQKITSSSNPNMTTNTSQATTASTSQSQINDSSQQIASVIDGVYKESVKEAEAKCKEQIENYTQFTTKIINNFKLNGIL